MASSSSSSSSSLLLLEHLNLNVPSHTWAKVFYGHVLGLPLDPRRDREASLGHGTLWYNLGSSQMHLPAGQPQQWRGVVVLAAAPSALALIAERARDPATRSDLAGSQYTLVAEGTAAVASELKVQLPAAVGEAKLVLRGPYGNCFAIVPTVLGGPDPRGCQPRGEAALASGIAQLVCLCQRGDAPLIAAFYQQLLGAKISTPATAGEATITFGGALGEPVQALTFAEAEELPEDDGHHLALYFRSHEGFLDSFERLEQAGLLFVNPRFADRVTTREGAEAELQYRFRDLVDLSSGRLLLTLEHEVRSPLHPSCPFGRKTMPPENM